jgi:hypothetical protein
MLLRYRAASFASRSCRRRRAAAPAAGAGFSVGAGQVETRRAAVVGIRPSGRAMA